MTHPKARFFRIGSEADMSRVVSTVAGRVRAGDVAFYPTDTTYALGAAATIEKAVNLVYSIKGRPREKALTVTVADLDMAEEYVVFSRSARILANRFLPGPLTLVLKHRGALPASLMAGGDALGIRIPDSAVAIQLVREIRAPITATSANLSGLPPSYSSEEFSEQLRRLRQYTVEADRLVWIDVGQLPRTGVSTVVDCTGDLPRLLREGLISREALGEFLLGAMLS